MVNQQVAAGVLGGWTRRRQVIAGMSAAGVVLAACGDQTEPGASRTAEPVTISYLHDWSGGVRADWMKVALPKFTEEFPAIRIDQGNYSGGLKAAVLARAAADTMEDVVMGNAEIFTQLLHIKALHDITPILKTLRVNMNDLVHVKSQLASKDKQYGMPFQFSVYAMVVNKTMFRRVGAEPPNEKMTFPQVAELLRKVSRPEEDMWGLQTQASQWVYPTYVWGWGGQVWSPDLKKTLLDQPAAIEGLQFYVDMMRRMQVATPLTIGGALPQGVSFTNGNLAIGYNTSPGKGLDAQIAGKFEWDIMYQPLGGKSGKRDVVGSDQPNFITQAAAKGKREEQATRFITWMSTSKTAQDLVVELGPNAVPVLKSALNSPKYLAGPPASQKILVDQLKDLRQDGVFLGYGEWHDETLKALRPAFAGEESVPSAVREATRIGDSIFAKYASSN